MTECFRCKVQITGPINICVACQQHIMAQMANQMAMGQAQIAQATGANLYGQHRSAHQTPPSGSLGAAYPGPGGAGQAGGAYQAGPGYVSQNTGAGGCAGAGGLNQVVSMTMGTGWAAPALGHFGDPYAGSYEIEECGIRAGEFHAWRCWMIDISRARLHSMAVNAVWNPGEIMGLGRAGDMFEGGGLKLAPGYGNGVHAFKTTKQMKGNYPPNTITLYGVVALWGEVIEHEEGYRAEFAKIVSLDEIGCNAGVGWYHERFSKSDSCPSCKEQIKLLHKLQREYGVEGNSYKDFGLEA